MNLCFSYSVSFMHLYCTRHAGSRIVEHTVRLCYGLSCNHLKRILFLTYLFALMSESAGPLSVPEPRASPVVARKHRSTQA